VNRGELKVNCYNSHGMQQLATQEIFEWHFLGGK
jgi:hypothetical protein